MWASMKENIYCVTKLTEVSRPENYGNKRSCNSDKENFDTQLLQKMGNPIRKVLFRPNYPRTHFCELGVEDPSRNIIEMIFHRASVDPAKPPRKNEKVLRVKNSIEVLERFEKYREKVMKKANEQHKRHPRSTVDGNEMLLFYGTIMTCCHGKRKKVSGLCENPTCRLCRTIQSKFETEYMKRNGIRLSTSSKDMSENLLTLTKVKNMRRAVIVCRTIAGRVTNTVDEINYDKWDSVGSEGLNSNLEYLILKNPSAVLPCFIIVFT